MTLTAEAMDANGSERETHTPVPLTDPSGWVLHVSHAPEVKRLVVFVHGFMGNALGTWDEFPAGGSVRGWWRQADMLFVKYESTRDNINGVANRLRRNLEFFYPQLHAEVREIDGIKPRADVDTPYEELLLVGHSLGGVILRRSLADAAEDWEQRSTDDESATRPAILDGHVRLFSPAIGGFRAAGILGLLKATLSWSAVEMFVRRASAYTDLQPDSPTLARIRERTERLIQAGHESLRAHIVWANPDNVVLAERYDGDFVDDSWDETNHRSVCKPLQAGFPLPWDFVESGRYE